MKFSKVELSRYTNTQGYPGSILKILLWLLASALIFKTSIPFPSTLKIKILRVFGAKIGKGVVLKPDVSIKYPWLLSIGDNSWIGEKVWIDNLSEVIVGSNVCISQGAMLLTGNHDYTKQTFDLISRGIILSDGCWVGAKSTVCPGVVLGYHSLLTVGSVATSSLNEGGIYQGNPAKFKKARIIG